MVEYGINTNGKFTKNGVELEDAFVGAIDDVACLFVNGVSVGTLKDIGLRENIYSMGATEHVNELGEKVISAIRPNGDVVITVLDKDGKLVAEKCKVVR